MASSGSASRVDAQDALSDARPAPASAPGHSIMHVFGRQRPTESGAFDGTSPESKEAVQDEKESKRSKMGAYLKQGWAKGKEKSMDGLMKGKLKLEHAAGLGHRPNVIPPGEVDINGHLRLVEIGWHPVGGFAGKWFAEQTGLGKLITVKTNHYPDPTQHWAVLVGDYCHELWMDEKLDVIYINEIIDRRQWHTFEVGKTRFSDEALRQAGEMTIFNMRAARPAYNLISNNCQNFALHLLDSILIGKHRQFATSFAVFKRATGAGAIKDLFVDEQEEDETNTDEAVHHAQQVMDENTTKLDNHLDGYHEHCSHGA